MEATSKQQEEQNIYMVMKLSTHDTQLDIQTYKEYKINIKNKNTKYNSNINLNLSWYKFYVET